MHNNQAGLGSLIFMRVPIAPMPAQPPAPHAQKPNPLKAFLTDARLVPILNYFLVFFMVLTMGISGIFALLVATFLEDKAPAWIKTHYEFQKRTFWIGIAPVLLVYVAMLRLHVTNQMVMLALIAIPLIYTAGRSVMGFNHLFYERPVPNPKALFI